MRRMETHRARAHPTVQEPAPQFEPGMTGPRVSIEIVTRGEPSTLSVLDSIDAQTSDDIEVVIADSSEDAGFASLLDSRDVTRRRLSKSTGLYRAREACHQLSQGGHCLVLDATRLLVPECVEILARTSAEHDMIAIRETSLAATWWAELGGLDKAATFTAAMRSHTLRGLHGSVIPRFFRREALDSAFEALSSSVESRTLDRVLYGDHHLIFEAALKSGYTVGLEPRPLIQHIEDASMMATAKKYFRYGRSFGVLRRVPGIPEVTRLRGRRSRYARARSEKTPGLITLYAVQVSSFLAGLAVSGAEG